jgi:hypothetical protein
MDDHRGGEHRTVDNRRGAVREYRAAPVTASVSPFLAVLLAHWYAGLVLPARTGAPLGYAAPDIDWP